MSLIISMALLFFIAIMNKTRNHTQPLRIAFFGTPEFSASILRTLIKHNFTPSLIITKPDAPVGRKKILTPSPVKICALENTLPLLQPQKLNDSFFEIFTTHSIDLAIVVAYGKIFPEMLLALPSYGCLNVHASLLPLYRGASPIQSVLLNGEKQTGITLMQMEKGLDSGPIIAKQAISIADDETALSLTPKLAHLGGEVLLSFLSSWERNPIKSEPQEHNLASFCTCICKQDGKIDWNQPAQKIYNTYRAFTPWPGIFSFFYHKEKSLRVRFIDISLSSEFTKELSPGTLVYKKNSLMKIVAGNGQFLLIKKLQVEGKKETTPEEFFRGYPEIKGSLFY
ncbi:MAG: methionyl-tRNA formyltransferase [Candidatus Moranbacteria bacterium]|nr:methionyl-tRNA formyltransferase [Candidatus Moranbacteria bacterium]